MTKFIKWKFKALIFFYTQCNYFSKKKSVYINSRFVDFWSLASMLSYLLHLIKFDTVQPTDLYMYCIVNCTVPYNVLYTVQY